MFEQTLLNINCTPSLGFYQDLYQSVDRGNSGKVSSDSLKQILNMALDDRLTDEMFTEISDTMKV